MTPRKLFIVAAVCLIAVGAMSVADGGLEARIFQALVFFGAGVAVAQALRPTQPASLASAQHSANGAAEAP